MPSEKLTFRMLVDSIRQIHNQLAGQAAKAVNPLRVSGINGPSHWNRESETFNADRANAEGKLPNLVAAVNKYTSWLHVTVLGRR